MAKAQLEDGYTPIANKLLEAILRGKWTHYEMKVVLAVARASYGWSRKETGLSHGDISRMTDILRCNVYRTVKTLTRDNVLKTRRGSRSGSENVLAINPDFSSWKGRFRSVDKLSSAEKTGSGIGVFHREDRLSSTEKTESGNGVFHREDKTVFRGEDTINQENNGFLNQAIKQDTARLVDNLSKEKSFNGQTVKLSAILKGREAELKAGANPAALVDSLCQVSKFERSRVWAYVVQSRKANNPSGWLVNVLANGRYTPADWAAEEASNERRRFQD